MIETIEKIRASIPHPYELEDLGSNEYLVHTERYLDDGDELHIVLKVSDNGF